MRVTPQPHRPADACNVLAVGWLTETKESCIWTWRATDQKGRLLRASSRAPHHTLHRRHVQKITVLSLAIPSWERQGPWATVWLSHELSGNRTAALSTLTGRESEANNKEQVDWRGTEATHYLIHLVPRSHCLWRMELSYPFANP